MRRNTARGLGRLRNEQVHLRPAFALFVDLKNDRQRLSKGDGREGSQELRVFGLIPLRSESIGSSDEKLLALDLQRLRGLQPGLERLLGQLLARSIQQSRPS